MEKSLISIALKISQTIQRRKKFKLFNYSIEKYLILK